MKNLSDDTILARWLSGELTKAEEEKLSKTVDLEKLKTVVETGSAFPNPPFEVEKELAELEARKKVLASRNSTMRVVSRRIAAIAAVALVVLMAVYIFSPKNSQTYFAEAGTQKIAKLKDGSTVTMNADTKLNFEILKDGNRRAELEGEAFFDVEKGKSFKIETLQGTIEVLGTSFNVYARSDAFEVTCYSGKVKVVSEDMEAILTYGQKFEKENPEAIEAVKLGADPNWTRGSSRFRGIPLSRVFAEMARQYAIKIVVQSGQERPFTGRFLHDDLEAALKEVCRAMQLKYEIQANQVIISE